MEYRDCEIIISEHYGSLTEDGHSVFASDDYPFYRASCSYGTVYANTEIGAVQGILQIVDSYLDSIYPN
jgi:hypothetical protein